MSPQHEQPSTAIVDEYNRLATERFKLEIEDESTRQELKVRQQLLLAEFESKLARIASEKESVDKSLRSYLAANRSELIARGKQSFATAVVTTQLRRIPAGRKVTDWKGVMAVARALGVVRQIASMKVIFEPRKKDFLKWLDKHPKLQPKFASFIEDTEEGESFTIKPNAGHMVYYDGKRISPPPVSIKS